METENVCPGLTVRVSTFTASGLAAPMTRYIARARYVGVELP
jgi:hypothetical protein